MQNFLKFEICKNDISYKIGKEYSRGMKEVIDFNKAKNRTEKKKIIILISIIILVIMIAICSIIYASNKNFRNFMDQYLFRKNITDENVPTIEYDYESNTSVIPYEKYICILAENTLTQYNGSGKKEQEVKIEIK